MAMWFSSQIKPGVPGVYPVLVTMVDHVTLEPIGTAERFARWTGTKWCCWSISVDRAAGCEWSGPRAGYQWRPIQGTESLVN